MFYKQSAVYFVKALRSPFMMTFNFVFLRVASSSFKHPLHRYSVLIMNNKFIIHFADKRLEHFLLISKSCKVQSGRRTRKIIWSCSREVYRIQRDANMDFSIIKDMRTCTRARGHHRMNINYARKFQMMSIDLPVDHCGLHLISCWAYITLSLEESGWSNDFLIGNISALMMIALQLF